MKKVLGLHKKLLSGSLSLFFFAVILFWLKTYAAYQIEFDLGIENSMQEFLLFLNPLSSALLFFGFALLFTKRGQNGHVTSYELPAFIFALCKHWLLSIF